MRDPREDKIIERHRTLTDMHIGHNRTMNDIDHDIFLAIQDRDALRVIQLESQKATEKANFERALNAFLEDQS